jgi:hypothetical protein
VLSRKPHGYQVGLTDVFMMDGANFCEMCEDGRYKLIDATFRRKVAALGPRVRFRNGRDNNVYEIVAKHDIDHTVDLEGGDNHQFIPIRRLIKVRI